MGALCEVGYFACDVGETRHGRQHEERPSGGCEPPRFRIVAQIDN
jgi:hypothetical protein